MLYCVTVFLDCRPRSLTLLVSFEKTLASSLRVGNSVNKQSKFCEIISLTIRVVSNALIRYVNNIHSYTATS